MHVNHYFPRFLVIHKKCLDGIGTSGINTSTTSNSTCCQKPFSSSCSSCSKHSFPFPPTQQDPDVRSQDKTRHLRIRSRGDVGEASGMNNPPAINPINLFKTDIFMCHVHHRRISCVTEQTQSISELCLRAGRLHQENDSRLQILHFITPSGGQMQQLMWWYGGGVPVPLAWRWTETVLLPETDVSQWGTRRSCLLLYLAIALNALVIIRSAGLFHFCWLLHSLAFFLSSK